MSTEKEIRELIQELLSDKAVSKEIDTQDNNGNLEGLYLKIWLPNAPPMQKMIEAEKCLEKIGQCVYQITHLISKPSKPEFDIEAIFEKLKKSDEVIDMNGRYSPRKWAELIALSLFREGKEDEAREYLQKWTKINDKAFGLINLPENYYYAVVNVGKIKCSTIRLQKNNFELIIGKTSYTDPLEFTLETPPTPDAYSDILKCYLNALE
jgi:hypothetical protein